MESKNFYHRSHRRDDRLKAAEAYRIEAEKAELDREMREVAEDIIESMTDDLEEAVSEKVKPDPITDYSDFIDRGNV